MTDIQKIIAELRELYKILPQEQWDAHYDNDVGKNDEYFVEWYECGPVKVDIYFGDGEREVAEATAKLIATMRNNITALLDYIAELEKQIPKWQPIETAPKDGRTIMVYSSQADTALVRSAYYLDGEGWSESGFESQEAFAGWWAHTSSLGAEKLCDGYEPTHWMPLQTPPEEK